MAQTKLNYLFLTLTTLLLTTTIAEATLVKTNKFCQAATYKPLCNHMVGDAQNLHDAAVNAMETTLAFAKQLQATVDKVRPALAHLAPETRESILSTCVEDFERNVDDIQKSLDALNEGDMGTLRIHLSAVFGTECADSMAEFGADFPLNKMSKFLGRHVDNCFAVVDQN